MNLVLTITTVFLNGCTDQETGLSHDRHTEHDTKRKGCTWGNYVATYTLKPSPLISLNVSLRIHVIDMKGLDYLDSS